jgi:hypothetical protein
MKLAVLAYQDVGYECLDFLIRAGADIRAVVTHEDDPGGRDLVSLGRRWSSGKRVYAFTDRENYERLKTDAGASVYLIVGNDYNVVATNHPPAEREAVQTLDLASK